MQAGRTLLFVCVFLFVLYSLGLQVLSLRHVFEMFFFFFDVIIGLLDKMRSWFYL